MEETTGVPDEQNDAENEEENGEKRENQNDEEKKEEEEEEYVEPWRKDIRLMYIRLMVEKLGNLKAEQWLRMIEKIENRTVVFDFLDNVENVKLLFVKFGASMLPSLNEFPSTKGRFIYFLRRLNREEITDTNYKQAMLIGSCSENPVRDFSVYVNNAIVPL